MLVGEGGSQWEGWEGSSSRNMCALPPSLQCGLVHDAEKCTVLPTVEHNETVFVVGLPDLLWTQPNRGERYSCKGHLDTYQQLWQIKAKENYDDDKDLDNGDDGDLDNLDDDGGGLTDSGRAGCDQGRPMRCCP